MLRAAMAAVVAVPALLGSAVGASAAVPTGEVYRYPVGYTSTVTLAGHGYGHGRGMSQWGAYGAATQGKTWRQIVAFYYPGTTQTAFAQDPTVRIRLDQVGTAQTYLTPAAGLRVSLGRPASRTVTLPTTAPNGASATAYRVVRNGATLKVQVLGGTWQDWDVTGNGSVPSTPFVVNRQDGSPVTTQAIKNFSGGSMPAKSRTYRGSLVVYPGSGAGTVSTVNELAMDLYLRAVVPKEVSASWHSEALAAQAVAARTYSAYEREHAGSRNYDLCDTTACQVYAGLTDGTTSVEQARTNDAIAATGRTYLTYSGAAAFTQFSASNGGFSTAGGQPYLVAKADPYDGVVSNSAHSWTKSLSISSIQGAYPSIGTFTAIRVDTRDGNGEWGGRVLDMMVQGTSGSVSTTGASFASRMGLMHQWFRPTNAAPPAWPRDFSGDGLPDVLGRNSQDVVMMHRGNGRGGWVGGPVEVGHGWGTGTRVLTAGPWDQDANGDLLAVRADGSMWLYAGNGDGTWASPRNLEAGWGAYTTIAAVGDLTGDGLGDLLARHPDGTLYVVPGDGKAGHQPRRMVSKGWGGFTAVFSPGDFNRDGKVDLMTRDAAGVLYFYPGKGNGTFGPRSSLGSGWAGYTALMSAGDFTGDAVGDVMARGSDGILYAWRGNGAGKFTGRTALGSGWGGYTYLLP